MIITHNALDHTIQGPPRASSSSVVSGVLIGSSGYPRGPSLVLHLFNGLRLLTVRNKTGL